ncbi:MAG: PD40 domain-containing protein [Bacteroidales bacterium]|jgi:outer membrane protein OmpA-like peptidoglycan-associated protein|nr:PD40 domain-containing protein [Bacteroidales bacterium]MCB9028920.1 PD40 domain-containing protein [Bacteroidales bacterium]MDD3735649.1 OmpA family protein [Bacteroidales bacterium]NLD64185.1 OmpA family protein [Bacteroidales bacterium]HNT93440.1 OmpA family protein [Bacteroidales bacterium]
MKVKTAISALLMIALMSQCTVTGQTLHTRSNRALKYYDQGKRDYDLLYYDRAERNLKLAVGEDSRFYEAHILLGQLYTDTGDWENAVIHYRTAVAIDPLFFPPALFSLGRAEMRTGRYTEALNHLESYLKQLGSTAKLRAEAEKMIGNCRFALSFPGSLFDVEPVNAGDSVNTALDEYWPSVTGDGQQLIFTREVKRATAYGQDFGRDRQEDFYVSNWTDKGYWGLARSAGAPLNTAGNEGAQSISSDGRYMYFTACDRSDGHGRCDIYFSSYDGSRWSPGINLGSPVNTAYWESQPSISPNGKMLFFVSNRPGGLGGMDIWYSTLCSDGRWSRPVNPGKEINTSGDEFSPFIYFDSKTLYFSSNGRESFGGHDIYVTTMNRDSTWAEPQNLGPPVNTPADETGLVIESSGKRAWFSSVHTKENGKDIFYLDLPASAQPEPVLYFKGNVIDKASGQPIKARYELTDLTNRVEVISSVTDNRGGFFVCLPQGSSYGLNVTANGYMIFSENFDFAAGYTSAEPYMKTIALNRVREGEFMRMYNVFYDTDSWELHESSKPELEQLLEFLQVNPTVVIEVGGHTDADGTDEHNQLLSERRANSVREFLVKRGIAHDRIFVHGYGEGEPVADNLTAAGKRLNRRTEITILSEGTHKK